MKVCVQGLWHLGLVTAAGLAAIGNNVIAFDPNNKIISDLNSGKLPIFEPGLDELISDVFNKKLLEFESNQVSAYSGIELLWITYDTPVNNDDIADFEYVMEEIKNSIKFVPNGVVVLVSSQLPLGSICSLEKFVADNYPDKEISFAYSPENLRLGNAIKIFLDPERIIVGIRSEYSKKVISRLLAPIKKRIEWMGIESAEMTKHAINAFLALSITFINEIATICELFGSDAKEVERGLKTESRIGPRAYLSPGSAFAGGTLARDIEYLESAGKKANIFNPLLASIKVSNSIHKNWVRRKLTTFLGSLEGKKIVVWGLTYKPGTDTLRRSLSVDLINWLIENGAKVQVYDPVVKELPREWNGFVEMNFSPFDSIEDVDCLVIGTEWSEFREYAYELHKKSKPSLLIIDTNRHIKSSLEGTRFKYLAVGIAE